MKKAAAAVLIAALASVLYAQDADTAVPAPAAPTPLGAALAELADAGTSADRAEELLAEMHPVEDGWTVDILSSAPERSEFEFSLRIGGTEFTAVAYGSEDAARILQADFPALRKTLAAKISESAGNYSVEYYRLKLAAPDGTGLLDAEFLKPDGAWAGMLPLFASMASRMDAFAEALEAVADAPAAAAAVGSYMDDIGALYARYEELADKHAGDNLGVPPLAAQRAAQDIDQANLRLSGKTGRLRPFAGDEAVREAVLRARDLPGEFSGRIIEEAGLDEGDASIPFDPNKDYSDLVRLFEDFVSANLAFSEAAEAATEPKAAAAALRAFAEALGPLYDRMRTVVADNPELAGMAEPPEILQPVFARMNELGPRVQEAMGRLQPYAEDEEVKEALQGLYALGS